MRIPFPNSTNPEEQPFSAGGFAPQSVSICLRRQTAALAVLLVVFVAAVGFAWVLIWSIGANVVSSWPAHSEMYRSPMEPAAVCSVTSMECVEMAMYGSAASRRISTPCEPVRTGPCIKRIEADDPNHIANVRKALLAGADLSEPQMFAMMNMSADYRQQAIWHYARQNVFELPPFTFGTFAELRERGLAEKPEGSRYHRLTLAASPLAAAVADELQRRYQIHAPLVIHPRRGEITKFVTFRCTCNWSCGLTAGDRMQAKASRAFSSHLRSVNTIANVADSVARASLRHRTQTGEG